MDATERAFCCHCGTNRSFAQLEPAANGGAMCTDWFRCQQLRDMAKVMLRQPPARPAPPARPNASGYTR